MPGVPRDEATAHDFMMVRAALVQRLGGANNALVWSRIYFRCSDSAQSIQDEDGLTWWRASNDQIGAEVGLTGRQVHKALTSMRDAGFVESVEHRIEGNYDRTQSWRIVFDAGDVEVTDMEDRDPRSVIMTSPIGDHDLTDRLNVPSHQEVASSSEVAGATIRDDVEEILGHLDTAIERNGSPKPTRTKKNRDAARLLLDRDGKTVEQVKAAIDWATTDGFWRANILSMAKLREKYEQLRLQAARTQASAQTHQPAYAGREEYTPPE